MSEINDDKPRARRRALRSAGPPPAEGGATPEGTVSGVGDGGSSPAVTAGRSASTASVPTSGSDVASTKAEPATSEAAAPKAEPSAAESVPVAGAETAPSAADDTAPTKADTVAAKAEPASDPALSEAEPAAAKVALDKDTDETPAPETATPARSWKRLALTAAAAIAAIAIVVSAVLSTLAVRDNDARDERRNEYLQTARQTVLNLTTIRADSAREDIDRILSVASGDFKTEFDGRVDPFTDIVQQAKVVSTGEIVEAALERDDENSAQVLVAAKQTLTNAGQAEPQTRYYRFRVTIARGDEGLTASKVEFVA
ncbi:hypothetical protein [Nocardia asteroides]|uniref:hypothetical protein n=1 Tax=Nocardia asteroides TaxID=1824 RepID=UPI001E568A14|nr:hypothetical protein [Nocardia asteroides]UGT59707.1 hypothetical protein LTT61_21015 [Nocardia asteroides]